MRALLLFLALLPQLACAASAHEMAVGAQTDQICPASTLLTIGRFLGLEGLDVRRSPDARGLVTAAACKKNPGKPDTAFAAVAYDTGSEDAKALVIVLLRESDGKVLAHYQGEVGEDAGMRVDPGSLWIDTAPYLLSAGVRAFGVDITSGYIPHCGDGGSGATRTLYVQEGRQLRPIFSLTMSYWRFLRGGNSRCRGSDQDSEPTVIANTDLAIGLADTSTNGYRDLVVTAVTSDDGEQHTHRKLLRYTVRYDGREYRSQGLIESFDKWNR
jgi:hypothetical protein